MLAFGFPNLFHEEHRFRLTLFADGQERRDGAGVTRSQNPQRDRSIASTRPEPDIPEAPLVGERGTAASRRKAALCSRSSVKASCLSLDSPDLPIRCGCTMAQCDRRRMKPSPPRPISAETAQLDNAIAGSRSPRAGMTERSVRCGGRRRQKSALISRQSGEFRLCEAKRLVILAVNRSAAIEFRCGAPR